MSSIRVIRSKPALRAMLQGNAVISKRKFATESCKLIRQSQHPKSLAATYEYAGHWTQNSTPPSLPVEPMPSQKVESDAETMPPDHAATVGRLTTFVLPDKVLGTQSDIALGRDMVNSWRRDGIFQIRVTTAQQRVLDESFIQSKEFFELPHEVKAKHVDDQSFAGYIASGEEVTAGIRDYSEIFTVTKDLGDSDKRVQEKWPCHGPCPWPNRPYELKMKQLMSLLGDSGEKLLKLTALGLGLADRDTLTNFTKDGWHHMRILRFPAINMTNGKGKAGRGIGSHTDYGLLVIAGQDHVGGLFVRKPMEDAGKNWEKSTASLSEMDDKWTYVPPVRDTFTVFPGDMMQYLTSSFLPSTPHKVGLNTRERFAFAYFHEPNFAATLKPLPEFNDDAQKADGIMYGEHFTKMFMRNYGERVTAKRMLEERRMDKLSEIKKKGMEEFA